MSTVRSHYDVCVIIKLLYKCPEVLH